MPSKSTQTNNKDQHTRTKTRNIAFVLVYVASVLLVDWLAISGIDRPFDWSFFQWMLEDLIPLSKNSAFGRFDLFKFVFWFLIPFLVARRTMDWQFLLRGPWTRLDAAFVLGLAFLGMAAMFLIPLVPELRAFYPSLDEWSPEARRHFFFTKLIWTASWLVGWEFMHRYFLLRAVQPEPMVWSRCYELRQWAWLVVPLMETAYHLQKALLEAFGMFFFSMVLTLWCLQRRNWLIAFVVHLIIEVELLLFMTLAP